VLAGVSSKMPALMEAYKLSSRAAHVGFDCRRWKGCLEKLAEETTELREELKAAPVKRPSRTGIARVGKAAGSARSAVRQEDEVGDLFFVLVNIARYLSLDPESALRKTNRKFKRRFHGWRNGCAPVGEPHSSVDGRTGNTMARGEAAGKTSVTGAATRKITIRKCEAFEEMQACFALA